ncbi:hypothetical protein ACOACO_13185 [Nocardioides sp. CPCC 205120]|uniref:hypothetical protein n=1 Tax=Nocardioides sp. CPCC 205120 TaxID=3406462 RepID=UPI003B5118DD
MSRPQGSVGVVAVLAALVVLVVVVLVVLLVGGEEPGRGDADVAVDPAASSAASSAAPSPASPTADLPVPEPPRRGVRLDLAPSTVRGGLFEPGRSPVVRPLPGVRVDDAVGRFVECAGWLLSSQDVRDDPSVARAAFPLLLPSDLGHLAASGDDALRVDFRGGAYRLYGHSGSAEAPDMVMLQSVAQVTDGDGRVRWVRIVGMMAADGDAWTPQGIRAEEVAQPASPELALVDLPRSEAVRLLGDDGFGWRAFAS